MANTKAGGAKVRQAMIEKFGSKEAYSAHMSAIGRKGGANGKGDGYRGGFAADREAARIAGAKGGRISRRRKAEAK